MTEAGFGLALVLHKLELWPPHVAVKISQTGCLVTLHLEDLELVFLSWMAVGINGAGSFLQKSSSEKERSETTCTQRGFFPETKFARCQVCYFMPRTAMICFGR